MRVFVTGAGGFAGGHIARRLASAGFDVLAGTRTSHVKPPFDGASARRFQVLRAALEDRAALPRDIDAIVHAAAASPSADVTVDRMTADNVAAMRSLVRHALEIRAKVFIFLSSVSAFGAISATVLDEETPAVNPDHYGITKLMGERQLASVERDLPSLAIRLPSVIGRGSRRNWPSECLRRLKTGMPLSFFNPEAPFNNLVHEQDLAALAERALSTPPRGHDMVVVGAHGRITVGEAVRILTTETGSASAVTSRRERCGAFVIDWSKAARTYGFAPMPTEQALRRLAEDEAVMQ